jgi:hypothetical protein
MIEFFTNFDWTVLNWIHDTFTCPVLDYLMPKITALGDGGLIWIVTALVLLLSKKYRRCGITLIVGLIMGVVVGNVFLKNFFERARTILDGSFYYTVNYQSNRFLISIRAYTVICHCCNNSYHE